MLAVNGDGGSPASWPVAAYFELSDAEVLLRQLADALKAVGDTELAAKFDDAIARIKRDIIFAASLFL